MSKISGEERWPVDLKKNGINGRLARDYRTEGELFDVQTFINDRGDAIDAMSSVFHSPELTQF